MTGPGWRKYDAPTGLYLVLSREADATVDRTPFHQAHLDWLNEGHDAGRILLSGPSRDRALGIYVVRGATEDDAAGYVRSDPYHSEGIRSFELVDWEMQRRTLLPGLTP